MTQAAEQRQTGDRLWPWRPFVRLSVASALGPGLVFALLLGFGPAAGLPIGRWYPSLVQAHAYVMLMGWGVGMIIGVALHFLPRLRGAKQLVWAPAVPLGFWIYAAGLLLRAVGPPLLALLREPFPWLNAAVALGSFLQLLGLALLLSILAKTFRTGPPLAKRKGFLQVLPALGAALVALALAHVLWGWAVIEPLLAGQSLALLSPRLHRLGAEFILFGGIFAISMAMSARLFPLSFRIRQPSAAGIRIAAGLLVLGVVLGLGRIAFQDAPATVLDGVSTLCFSAGIVVGAFAIRVLHPRAPFKADKQPYRFRNDPSGAGVLTAYIWAIIGAIFLCLFATSSIIPAFAPMELARVLALHAMGLGFMTLLIISVGWAMLPGFAGKSPRGRAWIWSAITFCNLAVALRVVPPILALPATAQAHSLACAGLAAWLGVAAFAVALFKSFRG